ncbi:protein adenylyltransferase SelO [Gaopeijia maritima]|uniref:Protein nucleotidyltransferase YdiU n=1 Tax=Gaopeijia maritima TaxID=3119007 RepID=A0ABU9E683_9BACT
MNFPFDNTFAEQMTGFYAPWQGASVPDPQVALFNRELAQWLGLDAESLDSAEGAAIFAGAVAPEGASPLAQVYAGHQFGGFSPQLGDGRALLVGELIDPRGARWDLHLKGSGPTPFSRGGDGKASLAPVLREYLIGEAMHALGIPTSRALAAVTTGEPVRRNGRALPGAVLARIASSHLRVGTVEFFARRGQHDHVRQLVDYALRRHAPDRAEADDPALELLRFVRDRQAALVARWMGIGFVHGVMNTDNTTLSGETIDYGPCAFMDRFDPGTVFSSIDHGGRYAYGNQPSIMQWNVARLAECLLPLFDAPDIDAALEIANHEVDAFGAVYQRAWRDVLSAKLGLTDEGPGRGALAEPGVDPDDDALARDLFTLLQEQEADFTGFFRHLSAALLGDSPQLRSLLREPKAAEGWLERWRTRVGVPADADARREALAGDRARGMNRFNPLYVPRNHVVEEALQTAERELDLGPVKRLLAVLADPFTRQEGAEDLEHPAPVDAAPFVTFCGT